MFQINKISLKLGILLISLGNLALLFNLHPTRSQLPGAPIAGNRDVHRSSVPENPGQFQLLLQPHYFQSSGDPEDSAAALSSPGVLC
jgi:hypothetical protein